MPQIREDCCEEKCKIIYQLVYLNMLMKQFDELSVFGCLSLSIYTSWNKFQLAFQYVPYTQNVLTLLIPDVLMLLVAFETV
jgi:hypothetical protein